MNTIAGWMLAAVLTLPTVGMAQINALPSQPHLLVKGQAFRTVDPDRFIVDLKISKTELQPDLARKFVEDRARLVLDGLQRDHVLKDSLYASALSISPQSRYEAGKSVFEATRVERRIRGTFTSLKDVRAFLGDLDANENVQVLSMQTAYADAAALRAELKREAATQSRQSAQGLAAAYGSAAFTAFRMSLPILPMASKQAPGRPPQRQRQARSCLRLRRRLHRRRLRQAQGARESARA
ncbi:SIMPL domain-containing protein [Xanthomonas citri]|uniref:SIMPL domain-containing protein n=1 Tax=Xanthomonas citri TaxID=346 RepID=UPI000B5C5BBE|nr:hypothetical protein XcvCFBP7113P_02445 [Xanthomonas citri pv. vignicola]